MRQKTLLVQSTDARRETVLVKVGHVEQAVGDWFSDPNESANLLGQKTNRSIPY